MVCGVVSRCVAVVGTPRFVYGGIGPYAVLASKTAQSFAGQNLNSIATLSNAMVALQGELVPDQPPVAASAAYRVSLACSLLYKFYLTFIPNANPRVQSGVFVRVYVCMNECTSACVRMHDHTSPRC